MESAEFQLLKRQALTRRANKLIQWLHRPDYAVYVDKDSITQLIKLIDLIKWALEYSIPDEDWKVFRILFNNAIKRSLEKAQDHQQEQEQYESAVQMVVTTLRLYLEHINK